MLWLPIQPHSHDAVLLFACARIAQRPACPQSASYMEPSTFFSRSLPVWRRRQPLE